MTVTQDHLPETGESYPSENSIGNQPAEKKAYARPALRVYGSVAELTAGSAGSTVDGGSQNPKVGTPSDRRFKENITRIGEHPLGVGVYLFDYLPQFRDAFGHGRQFGVMADEVEAVMPEAVFTRVDEYKLVDYARLGISRPEGEAAATH